MTNEIDEILKDATATERARVLELNGIIMAFVYPVYGKAGVKAVETFITQAVKSGYTVSKDASNA